MLGGQRLDWRSRQRDDRDELDPRRHPPQPLSSGVRAAAVGVNHACALTVSGAVLCWGDNTYGALGNGTTQSSATPVAVPALTSGVVALSLSGPSGVWSEGASCALTSAGGVLCWGVNTYGQVGDGTMGVTLSPSPVFGLSSLVAAVSAGGDHNCAITTAGRVFCWGNNALGQLGDGTTQAHPRPVEVFGM